MRRRRSPGWTFPRDNKDGSRTWYVGYYVDGKRVREAAGPRKSDAAALLERRSREIGDGRWVPPMRALTFDKPRKVADTTHPNEGQRGDNLMDLVRADYRANGRRSLDRVEQCIAHLRRAFGQAQAADITAARLASYMNDRLDAGAAASTVRNELNVLKRATNLAVRAGSSLHGRLSPRSRQRTCGPGSSSGMSLTR